MTSHVVGSKRVADMEGRDCAEAGGALPVREMLRDGEWGWDNSMSFMSLLGEPHGRGGHYLLNVVTEPENMGRGRTGGSVVGVMVIYCCTLSY